MNLDLIASPLCLFVSVVLYGLFIVTSRRCALWANLPEYVRKGVLIVGVLFMWRGANLSTLAYEPPSRGQMNAEGFMTLVAVAYTLGAVGVWVLAKQYGPGLADRLAWFELFARNRPELVPAVVAEAAVLEGANVAKPGASASDYAHEIERTPAPTLRPDR